MAESKWKIKGLFRSSQTGAVPRQRFDTAAAKCFSHETKISSWLPPVENWDSGGTGLPYGWEAAVDKEGKPYFINHVNKTTTYEDPRKDMEDEPPPQPREVELFRDSQLGFGFVAGSEKPVIVRFVKEGGPSENKLLAGDQILMINGEDVSKAPREHVIELVKSCKHSVNLIVCQPHSNNATRKSALLTAAKKAKLKSNPSRVRFAEGVVVNGSPLYCASTFDTCVPFIPNVLKVFLENGQTKTFKYDSTTTVEDVLNSLKEKLSIKCLEHFSLVVEHSKALRRNKLTLLDPKDTLAKIAARPGAHHLRCLFRVTFVPKDAYDLLQKDPAAFEYLYLQCCNDVVQERFAPELKYDVALRLAALHIQQHAISSGLQGKITIKTIERECGLENFVPVSLLETMKRKELRKILSHFLKLNQALSAPGQKHITALQAKLHYLQIVSELTRYGAKIFPINLKDSNMEIALLVSPKHGISHVHFMRNTMPVTLAQIEEVTSLLVTKEDELSYNVEIRLKDPDKENLCFCLEDREAEELVLLLQGYHRLLAGRELPVQWEATDPWWSESAPSYHGRHTVREAPWSYPPHADGTHKSQFTKAVDLAVAPPPYIPSEVAERQLRNSSSQHSIISLPSSPTVDHNMNETQMANGVVPTGEQSPSHAARDSAEQASDAQRLQYILGEGRSYDSASESGEKNASRVPTIEGKCVLSMDLAEEKPGKIDSNIFEVKNEEVLRRVSEMNRIVADAENYLCDDRDVTEDRVVRDGEVDGGEEWDNVQVDSQIKAADSLLLLTHIDDLDDEFNATILTKDSEKGTPDNEVSPSESDTDSLNTPNDSPLRRSAQARSSIGGHPRTTRTGSSFGLHSPDVIPGLDHEDQQIVETLKQLQTNGEIQLPFAEGTLYLDPDIIDLTMIPPPITPDVEPRDVPPPLDQPPTPFLDKGVQIALAGLNKLAEIKETDQQLGPPGETVDLEQLVGTADSARVVAELDNLCDALSELQASSLASEETPVTLEDLPPVDDIEKFIASVAVPPPPIDGVCDFTGIPVGDDDLSAYIIPPPPCSSPAMEAQIEVIEKFRQAAEDLRKIMNSDANEACPGGNCGEKGMSGDAQNASVLQNDGMCTTLDPETNISVSESFLLQALRRSQSRSTSSEYDFPSGSSSGYETLTSLNSCSGDSVFRDDRDSLAGTPQTPADFDLSNDIREFILPDINVSRDLQNRFPLSSVGSDASRFSAHDGSLSCKISSLSPKSDRSVSSLQSSLSDSSSSSGSSSGSHTNSLGDSAFEEERPKAPPRLKKSTERMRETKRGEKHSLHGGSFEDLRMDPTDGSTATIRRSPVMPRSMSWSSLHGVDATTPPSGPTRTRTGPPRAPKPPLPPASPLTQDRMKKLKGPSSVAARVSPRSSFRSNSVAGIPESHSPVLNSHQQVKRLGSFPGQDTGKKSYLVNGVANGVPYAADDSLEAKLDELHSLKQTYAMAGREQTTLLPNGCVSNSSAARLEESLISSLRSNTLVHHVTDGHFNSAADSSDATDTSSDDSSEIEKDGVFFQAQHEISAMVLHLDEIQRNRIKNCTATEADPEKFASAKESLISESRQFVTASKLFVKSATEASDKLLENLTTCVTLLDHMYTVSHLVVMHMSTPSQITCLSEKLKDVALSYSHTVSAAHKAVTQGNSHMGALMQEATALATALTALMRTLRSFGTS